MHPKLCSRVLFLEQAELWCGSVTSCLCSRCLCAPEQHAVMEQPQMPRERLYFLLALFFFSSFIFFLESLALLALW